eukprot:4784561-Pyramimonas_sp.AAC.1
MEKHCETLVISKGFEQIPSWRNYYYHPELTLFLIVYANDFQLAGSAVNLPRGWDLILSPSETAPTGIDMDPPTPVGRYLGRENRLSERWIDWQ